jgi:mono/diheme cytochrome c family protein
MPAFFIYKHSVMRLRQILFLFLFSLVFSLSTWLSGLAASPYRHPSQQVTAPPPTSSPTYDPLAIPVLPAHPTQFDLGKNLYYYHCMPCHGDVGQGLTDAWRMVWEEDHRNCWGRGCHGGRQEDGGFPIPTVVPAIIAPTDLLAKYPDLQSLVSYLHETHPPQKPGKLKDEEYRDLAIFLWVSNNRPLPAEGASSPTALPSPTSTAAPSNTPTAVIEQLTRSPSPLPVLHTPPPTQAAASVRNVPLFSLAVIALFAFLILIWVIMKRSHRLDRH